MIKTLLLTALLAAASVLPSVRQALVEAQLHLNAGQWTAAERTLKDVRQRLWLTATPEAEAVRVKVEFILWDLRMKLYDQAKKDLSAVVLSLTPGQQPPHQQKRR